MKECDCGHPLNEDDECARCTGDWERMCREYGRGNVRAAMQPPGPWKSREDCLRDAFWED